MACSENNKKAPLYQNPSRKSSLKDRYTANISKNDRIAQSEKYSKPSLST
jgi:hypothetical protein